MILIDFYFKGEVHETIQKKKYSSSSSPKCSSSSSLGFVGMVCSPIWVKTVFFQLCNAVLFCHSQKVLFFFFLVLFLFFFYFCCVVLCFFEFFFFFPSFFFPFFFFSPCSLCLLSFKKTNIKTGDSWRYQLGERINTTTKPVCQTD